MSHAVTLVVPASAGAAVLVLGVAGLVEALAETGLECMQQRSFRTDDGTLHGVDLVVQDKAAGASIGVKIDSKTGQAQFIAGDCKAGGAKGRALADRVVRQHVFHTAIGELRRKGYTITKQQKAADGSVTVVAQRWR